MQSGFISLFPASSVTMTYAISLAQNEGRVCSNNSKMTCHYAEEALVEKQKHKARDSNIKAKLTVSERPKTIITEKQEKSITLEFTLMLNEMAACFKMRRINISIWMCVDLGACRFVCDCVKTKFMHSCAFICMSSYNHSDLYVKIYITCIYGSTDMRLQCTYLQPTCIYCRRIRTTVFVNDIGKACRNYWSHVRGLPRKLYCWNIAIGNSLWQELDDLKESRYTFIFNIFATDFLVLNVLAGRTERHCHIAGNG